MKQGDRVIIAHGTEGSPDINWFPWLRKLLSEREVVSIAPQFPTPNGQSLNSWLQTLEKAAGDLSGRDILVGHSTGAIFFVNALNRIRAAVKATFLVGGFIRPNGSPKYDALNSTFFNPNLDWATIRRNSGKVFVYCGDNDPYVPLENGIELASCLGVKPSIVPGGGHLNGESGYTRFDELLKDLDAI